MSTVPLPPLPIEFPAHYLPAEFGLEALFDDVAYREFWDLSYQVTGRYREEGDLVLVVSEFEYQSLRVSFSPDTTYVALFPGSEQEWFGQYTRTSAPLPPGPSWAQVLQPLRALANRRAITTADPKRILPWHSLPPTPCWLLVPPTPYAVQYPTSHHVHASVYAWYNRLYVLFPQTYYPTPESIPKKMFLGTATPVAVTLRSSVATQAFGTQYFAKISVSEVVESAPASETLFSSERRDCLVLNRPLLACELS